ncbi:MAG TPA: ATPase domain-containing protein [Isosphaeraceae bacterium]|nr:ATPase domain-containing protein [Isosphaeraceae bacterium]
MLNPRLAFDLPTLDAHLGGGLLPGTLTVIAGATGAGKTQLGLRWANAGQGLEGRRGIVCDLTSRGDAQNHRAYAHDQLGWDLTEHSSEAPTDLDALFDPE